jgi:hypothetical protein
MLHKHPVQIAAFTIAILDNRQVGSIAFYDFLHTRAQGKRHVDIPITIQSHSVRAAPDVSNDIDNLAIFHDADGLGIDMGDVKRIVGSDIHGSAGFGDEFVPLLEELAGLIEYLYPIVFGIGHDDAVLRIHNHRMRKIELTWFRTLDSTNDLDELSVL